MTRGCLLPLDRRQVYQEARSPDRPAARDVETPIAPGCSFFVRGVAETATRPAKNGPPRSVRCSRLEVGPTRRSTGRRRDDGGAVGHGAQASPPVRVPPRLGLLTIRRALPITASSPR